MMRIGALFSSFAGVRHLFASTIKLNAILTADEQKAILLVLCVFVLGCLVKYCF